MPRTLPTWLPDEEHEKIDCAALRVERGGTGDARLAVDELRGDEVRVWAVAPDALDAPARAALADLLDADERARAARKLVAADRQVFEIAHGLLRRALSSVAPPARIEPRAWRFSRAPHGRPVLSPEHGLDLTFSLTHTRGLAACAVARGRDVGVDAEDLDRDNFDGALERSCFTAQERAALAAIPPPRRARERLGHFTLKEAYAKARGLGLRLDLQSFAVRLEPAALLSARDDEPARWHLERHHPHATGRHALAIAASRSRDEKLFVRFLEGAPPADVPPRIAAPGPAAR